MQSKKTGHSGLVIGLIGAGLLSPAIAHEQSSAEAAIDYRQSVMTVLRWNIKPGVSPCPCKTRWLIR